MRPGLGLESDANRGSGRPGWTRGRGLRGRPVSRLFVFLGFFAVATLLGLACAGSSRYRVLKFFFDGVPDPDARPAAVDPGARISQRERLAEQRRQIALRGKQFHTHPPYAQGKCRECHNLNTGRLRKPVAEGLCQTCHKGFPGDLRFVHGPVAVNACLFCHHPHRSEHPRMLHAEVASLCLRCHQTGDLTAGPHHADIGQRPCIDCHNPHGGDNDFFLKRTER